MGLFDEIGPVEENVSIETMPLVDLYKEGLKVINAFEKNPNAQTCEEVEKTLNMIVQRFDEVPAGVKGKIAGLPSVISGTVPSLRQMLALGPTAATVIPNLTGALKSSINFGIANL